MTIEIPDKIYRPCSTCSDDTCVFHGDKNTHEICTDYKDKRLDKAIEEIKNINPVYSTIGDRIPVLKNCDDIKAEVLAILDNLIAESEEVND